MQNLEKWNSNVLLTELPQNLSHVDNKCNVTTIFIGAKLLNYISIMICLKSNRGYWLLYFS